MRDAITAVLQAGFDVYMKQFTDDWFIFTDGVRIGYLGHTPGVHYTLSTRCKPSRHRPNGYRVAEHLQASHLTRPQLEQAFVTPHYTGNVVLWKNWAEFHHANPSYTQITSEENL
jgi:hypothetical protein